MKFYIFFTILLLFLTCCSSVHLFENSNFKELANTFEYNEISSPVIENVEVLSPCSVSISWNCEQCPSYIVKYIVYWNENGKQNVSNDVFSYVIKGLTASTIQEVYVSAVYENFHKYSSLITNVTTDPGEPSDIINLYNYGININYISFAWSATYNECQDIYLVKWNGISLCGSSSTVSGSDTTTEMNYIIDDPNPDTNYSISVAAVASDGTIGEESFLEAIVADPPPPKDINCSAVDSKTINVKWLAPNTSCPVVNYLISADGYILWNTSAKTNTSEKTKELEINLTELVPYTSYEIHIMATTYEDAGYGTYTECGVTTPEDVPGSPRNLEVSYASYSYISIEYDPPIDMNGFLLGYSYYLNEKLYGSIHSANTYYQFQNLKPNTNYKIQVYAETGAGFGEPAEMEATTTDDYYNQKDKDTRVGLIAGLSALVFVLLCVGGIVVYVKRRQLSQIF